MAKPDNREDNVEHLQQAVQNTIENFREDYLQEFGDEIPASEKEQIQDRNARRERSISGFRKRLRTRLPISKENNL